MICWRPDHYPQLELPAEYDARLHNYEHPEPCIYAFGTSDSIIYVKARPDCDHCSCDTASCCRCGGWK